MKANYSYYELIVNLEKAINELTDALLKDRAEKGNYEYWKAREYTKDLSFKKCQIIDLLSKVGEMPF